MSALAAPAFLGAPIGPISKIELAAQALAALACPPPPAAVAAFQALYGASRPTFKFTAGVYDDATVAAVYDILGTVSPCPSVDLVALARAAVAHPSFCSAYSTNASVAVFMAGYRAWKNPNPLVHVLLPPPSFAEVSSAINEVLGAGAAPTCKTTSPSPGGGGGSSPTSSGYNTGTLVVGAVALAAVGGLFLMMMQGAGRAAASGAGARTGAKPNPLDHNRAFYAYRKSLLDEIARGEAAAVVLWAQGREGEALRLERLVQQGMREAEAQGWAIEAERAYERGQRSGDRAIQRDMAQGF